MKSMAWWYIIPTVFLSVIIGIGCCCQSFLRYLKRRKMTKKYGDSGPNDDSKMSIGGIMQPGFKINPE